MTLLEARSVNFGYATGNRILHDVTFSIRQGVNIGIVGESGSGKSTILRLLLGLARPDSGEILARDETIDTSNRAFMKRYRRFVQPVFQDPYSSLDPRQRVDSILREPLRALSIPANHEEAIARVLEAVGLPPDAAQRYPDAFSGGQRQRIAIARAIIAEPAVLLADEAVSALDLSTRVRIVELMQSLGNDLTLVLVSHDLAVVAALCEEIIVLERGRIVEYGSTRATLDSPQHAYTRKLLQSVPRLFADSLSKRTLMPPRLPR